MQLVVLGVGHPKYHALLEDLARRHPGKFWALPGLCRRPGPPDRGRCRPVPDAQPVRTVRVEPTLQPGARDRADRAGYRRPGRHRRRRQSRRLSPTARPMVSCFAEPTPAGALADDRAGPGPLARPRRLGQVDADRDECRLVLGPQRLGVRRGSTRRSGAGPGLETLRTDASEPSCRSFTRLGTRLSLPPDVPSISRETTYSSSGGFEHLVRAWEPRSGGPCTKVTHYTLVAIPRMSDFPMVRKGQ